MNLGGTYRRGSTLPPQNNTEFGALNELNKRIRELNKTLCCLTGGAIGDPGGGGGLTPTPFTFYFGNGTFPVTSGDITAGTVGTGLHGQAETVMFANVTDDNLWFAEPAVEPIKTIWYNTPLNQGPIGFGETFGAPTIVGSWRLYKSSFPTTFVGTVQFKTS